MSPRPKMNEQPANLRERIKETAWRQIAEKGAATLSLRAIARELGITAPAIYNYFPRRDDLVTALIVDAFTSFGQAQKESDQPGRSPAERLRILGMAYRDWAMKYPQRYHLIFGTPIPGYHAPAEITLPAAAGSLIPLMECFGCRTANRKTKSSHPGSVNPGARVDARILETEYPGSGRGSPLPCPGYREPGARLGFHGNRRTNARFHR